jgi:hypothetical protein
MSKQAKSIFLFAVLYFLGLGGLLAYGFYIIHSQGAALEMARISVAEQSAKETAYTNVIRQTEATKSDRAELASFFITEKDTVSFIAELEQAAVAVGVSFETKGLSVIPATGGKPAELSIDCIFKGSESTVKKFITVLESIPYRMTMNHVVVTKKVDTQDAEGQALFKITLKP